MIILIINPMISNIVFIYHCTQRTMFNLLIEQYGIERERERERERDRERERQRERERERERWGGKKGRERDREIVSHTSGQGAQGTLIHHQSL
jgi:GAF domain-containing protein